MWEGELLCRWYINKDRNNISLLLSMRTISPYFPLIHTTCYADNFPLFFPLSGWEEDFTLVLYVLFATGWDEKVKKTVLNSLNRIWRGWPLRSRGKKYAGGMFFSPGENPWIAGCTRCGCEQQSISFYRHHSRMPMQIESLILYQYPPFKNRNIVHCKPQNFVTQS